MLSERKATNRISTNHVFGVDITACTAITRPEPWSNKRWNAKSKRKYMCIYIYMCVCVYIHDACLFHLAFVLLS